MSDADLGVPEYGQDALSVRDLFFAGSSGVHFFVEDADQENLYELLMKRCFPNIREIEIFPQGGKSRVIEHAAAGYRGYPGVRRIYVVDKDFDDLLGTVQVIEGLFYLNQYGIENFVVCRDSITEFCVQEGPKESRLGISRRIDFDEVLRVWVAHLDRLHRAFFLVQKYALGMPNTSLSVDEFVLKKDRGVIDPVAVSLYVDSVYQKLFELGVVGDQAAFEAEMGGAFTGDGFCNINGKFLVDLLYHHVKGKGLCGHVKHYSLVYRLAGGCSLEALSPFIANVNSFLSLERRAVARDEMVAV